MPDNASQLQRLRESAGLSRAELARAAQVSDRTVKRAEDGEELRTATRYKIIRGLSELSKRDSPYELDDVFPEAEVV